VAATAFNSIRQLSAAFNSSTSLSFSNKKFIETINVSESVSTLVWMNFKMKDDMTSFFSFFFVDVYL